MKDIVGREIGLFGVCVSAECIYNQNRGQQYLECSILLQIKLQYFATMGSQFALETSGKAEKNVAALRFCQSLEH